MGGTAARVRGVINRHPCRCLWRLFLQMTLMTPPRLTMRQLLHILLTDALTFMVVSSVRGWLWTGMVLGR